VQGSRIKDKGQMLAQMPRTEASSLIKSFHDTICEDNAMDKSIISKKLKNCCIFIYNVVYIIATLKGSARKERRKICIHLSGNSFPQNGKRSGKRSENFAVRMASMHPI
jgi:hypothetical protein